MQGQSENSPGRSINRCLLVSQTIKTLQLHANLRRVSNACFECMHFVVAPPWVIGIDNALRVGISEMRLVV